METIVQPLLEEEEGEEKKKREAGTSSTSTSTVMAALQQIFAGPAGTRLLALAVPQWLAAYRVTALATAARASGRLFETFAPTVIQRALSEANARRRIAVATSDDEHHLTGSADVDTAESLLWEALARATPDTTITHLLPRLGDSAVASRLVAATAVERWAAAVPDVAVLVSHGEAVLEALLPGMVDPDAQVRHRTYRAFVMLTERVPCVADHAHGLAAGGRVARHRQPPVAVAGSTIHRSLYAVCVAFGAGGARAGRAGHRRAGGGGAVGDALAAAPDEADRAADPGAGRAVASVASAGGGVAGVGAAVAARRRVGAAGVCAAAAEHVPQVRVGGAAYGARAQRRGAGGADAAVSAAVGGDVVGVGYGGRWRRRSGYVGALVETAGGAGGVAR
eukprot:ctg_2828.g390